MKSKPASDVLKLMDEDYSYVKALEKVLRKNRNKITRQKLEKDLDPFI